MKQTKFLILLMILAIPALMVHGAIIANESDNAYAEGNGNERSGEGLRQYIILGGSRYLAGYADYLMLLNAIEVSEIQGLDRNLVTIRLNNTIRNVEAARNAYADLKARAAGTPYWGHMFERLLLFDYAGFEAEKGLNPHIFKKVRKRLQRGDVTAVYQKSHKDTQKIVRKLQKFKKGFDRGQAPDIALLWRINQDFSESILFGQYVAEVFFSLKR